MVIEYDGSKDLLEGSVLKFYADWCGPCKMHAPLYKQLSEIDNGTRYVSINTEEFPEVAREYNVKSIPTLFDASGERVDDAVGWTREMITTKRSA